MKEKKKSNSKLLISFAIVLLIVGMSLILYPIISNYSYRHNTLNAKNEFIEKVNEPKEVSLYDKLYENLNNKNQELYMNRQQALNDPFAYEGNSINLEEYEIENNIIGFISIPKINVELPIYLGANTANLKKGAAHLTETSYPIGGINTNCVLAAHRGYDTMFRYIDRLEKEDIINIRNFREELVYKVTGTKIIEVDEINDLFIQEGKDMITLISCHPYGVNTQRYLVFAERVY